MASTDVRKAWGASQTWWKKTTAQRLQRQPATGDLRQLANYHSAGGGRFQSHLTPQHRYSMSQRFAFVLVSSLLATWQARPNPSNLVLSVELSGQVTDLGNTGRNGCFRWPSGKPMRRAAIQPEELNSCSRMMRKVPLKPGRQRQNWICRRRGSNRWPDDQQHGAAHS